MIFFGCGSAALSTLCLCGEMSLSPDDRYGAHVGRGESAQVVGQAEAGVLHPPLFRPPPQQLAVHLVEHAQPGDVKLTYAKIEKARERLGYNPKTQIREGLARFVRWYLEERKELLDTDGHR